MFLLFAAFGYTCEGTVPLVPDTRLLHTRGSFSVVQRDGRFEPMEDVARRFRLRSPDGGLIRLTVDVLTDEVRFTPAKPLKPGTYIIEQFVEFDAEGRRVRAYGAGPAVHRAWFAEKEVDVERLRRREVLEAPRNLQWFRSRPARSSNPHSGLRVQAEVAAKTLVELEVKGVGVIERDRSWASRNRINLWTSTVSACGSPVVDVPVDGCLEVRLVSVAPSGRRASTPWTSIPELEPPRYDPIPPHVSGQGLVSWRELEVTLFDGPIVHTPTECGRYVPTGEAERVADVDSFPLVSNRGRIRWRKGDFVDGVLVSPDDESSAYGVLDTASGFLVWGGSRHPFGGWLARVEKDRVVARSVPKSIGSVVQVVALEDGFEVTGSGEDGYWRRTMNLDLRPTSERSAVERPPRFGVVSHQGRSIVGSRNTFAAVERGRMGPNTRIAGLFRLAVLEEGVDVVWRGGPDPLLAEQMGEPLVWRRQRFVCSGDAVGIPDVWLPR